MNDIQNLRQKNKLSQEQLAAKMGIDRSTVAMWEIGKSMPRADKLPELAKILNCTIDDLFKNEEKGA